MIRPNRNARATFLVAALAATFLWLAMLGPAWAGLCGDDVAGARVPCACGDVVVSDTRLSADDPIATGRCMGDGLSVRAPSGATSIVLDLAGHSILGSGVGVGVRVVRGGSDGAVVVGDGRSDGVAVVGGFGTGFKSTGRRELREVRGLVLRGNGENGLVVRGDGPRIVDVTSENNGRDGVHAGGRAPVLENVSSEGNGRVGVRVTAPGAEIDARADENARGDIVTSPRARAGEQR